MGRCSTGFSEGEDPLVHSLDYDCVERFRLRRLLAFLRHYRYDGAFEALSKETTVLFRPEHLQHLVQEGLWSDAVEYFRSFVPTMLLPPSAKLLLKFMRLLSRIFDEDAGYEYDPYNPVQIRLYGRPNPGGIKLAKIVSSVHSEQVRASINWENVRLKAADIVSHWVPQISEFNEMCQLPLCTGKPANLLPIGLSSRGRRGLQKKSLGQIPANALARAFLSRKRLSSSTGSSHSGLPFKPVTLTHLAVLIEECLQAGKSVVLNGSRIETSYAEEESAQAGKVVLNANPIESSYAEGTNIIMGPSAHQAVGPGNNPKRPRAAEHEGFDTGKRQITERNFQDSGFNAHAVCLLGDASAGPRAVCLLGDASAGPTGINMKSWIRGSDCRSPTEIQSS